MSSQNFNPVTIIRKKRDGFQLERDEIAYLIDQYTTDSLPDYQMSAFLMASFLNGLDDKEMSAFTDAMLQSGIILNLDEIPGKKVDKHSTGGVGDKLSLILAPIVASQGISVPMISGRGLGHTGGTLDKLESIPGFDVNLSLERFEAILEKHQMVMAGQTEEIAPADKRLYALRDVTATVESIPLIAGSIMSKKLAEGIDALVLDVKFGSGAFMKETEDALKLAESLVSIGERFKIETVAYLTNMDQPVGYTIGNWFEVKESMEALHGEGPTDTMELVHLLAGTMIYLGDKANTVEEGIELSHSAIDDGSALNKWMDLVKEQGGDIRFLENPDSYPKADHNFNYISPTNGYITKLNAYDLGMASLELGGGRKTKGEGIDFTAGIILKKKVGEFVKKGETIAVGYTNNNHAIDMGREYISRAVSIGESVPESIKMITHRVDKSGTIRYNS